MIHDARRGDRGTLIDLATGQRLRRVFWCDLTDGPGQHEYLQWVYGPDGRPRLDPADPTQFLFRRVLGTHLLFVPDPPPDDHPADLRALVELARKLRGPAWREREEQWAARRAA